MSLLLPVLGFAWLSGEKTVTLSLPGGVRQVRTHATTVGELLSRSGTDLNAFNDVAPETDTALLDGMTIRVVLEPPVALDYRMLASLSSRVASQTQAQRTPTPTPGPSPPQPASRPAATAEPVEVTVTRDGITTSVSTVVGTVGEVLDELGIAVDGDDRVSPGARTHLQPGLEVVVQRVEVTTSTRTEPIAFPTVTQETDALPEGDSRELQAGQDGELEITEDVVQVDGAEESRTRVGERVVREPRPRIVEVGVAQPEPEPAPTESDDPPAEEAPANSEEGVASWYDNPAGGLTAAHRTLPLGTVVTVTNLASNATVQVTINDRGPYVDGRIIDLSRAAFDEIGTLSHGVINVRIEW